MLSKIQWKPLWLATQLYPQNDWTGRQNGVSDDVFPQAPFKPIFPTRHAPHTSKSLLHRSPYFSSFSSFLRLLNSKRFFTWSSVERSTRIDMPRLRWSATIAKTVSRSTQSLPDWTCVQCSRVYFIRTVNYMFKGLNTVNPEYFVRTQFSYPWLSNLSYAWNFRTVADRCGFSDLLCTFRIHFIFVQKPPCTKYTKITCIRNILDLQ